MTDEAPETLLTLTADIVSAHVSNNSVAVGDLPRLIGDVHAALSGLGREATPAPEDRAPAVSVRSSVKPDFIVCLEDGKKMKMLKRHLATDHQMTPADYRAKWSLPASYPMVAPNYSEARRGLAHQIGLGRKKGEERPLKASGAPAKRGHTKSRKPEADSSAEG